MPYIISTFEMRCAEQEAMADGLSERELMQTAGENAAIEIERFCNAKYPARHRQRYIILAGSGNNGGDAFVVARNLHAPVEVYATSPNSKEPASFFRDGLNFVDEFNPRPGCIIIDGLLGIGLNGPARPEMAELINRVNECGLPVISLDIPSGLNADDGTGFAVVHAEMTVTMHSPKQGMFVNRGPECCGIIRTVSIGANNTFSGEEHLLAFGEQEARAQLQRRSRTAHKYNFGHLLVLAGARDYPGAPVLAARAAERCGAGLVTLAVPGATSVNPVDAALIVKKLGDANYFQPEHLDALDFSKYNAILFGPGIGRDVQPAVLEKLLATDLPLVIDADGLRLLASNGKQFGLQLLKRTAPVVLTPHDGELNCLKEGIPAVLKMFPPCMYLVHKGAQTKVHSPDGALSINTSGNPALATAGTGDILSGMIASFLGQGQSAADAARLAVFLHGHAADIAPSPMCSFIADDLLPLIPQAIADISPLA